LSQTGHGSYSREVARESGWSRDSYGANARGDVGGRADFPRDEWGAKDSRWDGGTKAASDTFDDRRGAPLSLSAVCSGRTHTILVSGRDTYIAVSGRGSARSRQGRRGAPLVVCSMRTHTCKVVSGRDSTSS
jgi:hypothetical protein